MAYLKPLNTLVIIILISFANGDFTPLGDWPCSKNTGSTRPAGIPSTVPSSGPYISTDVVSNIDYNLGCNSLKLAGSQTWNLDTDASSLISGLTEYSFGFWVNFHSTISDNVFQFGIDSGPKYVVSSTKDGTLKASFYSDATTTSSSNDVSITVPLSNFYTDKWIFIVFHFKSAASGSVTLDVILPKTAVITKTSADFALPGGAFKFGKGIKANFNEVILMKTATINANLDTITLDDGTTQKVVAQPCTTPAACSDDVCVDNGATCLALSEYCTTCDATGCTACNADSSRKPSPWCQGCMDSTLELKNFHCCAVDHHCAGCSKKSTQCDVCATGYFLYDESGTSTTCLSCADSCVSCKPGPTCYACAETVTQTGSTCRVDSIGFEISVDLPNIVIDFAHPLSTGLAKSSFTATSASTQSITTTGWTFTGCVAGNVQCNIVTNNVHQSDLPLTLDIEFTQA